MQVVDFWHAAEYLWAAAEVLFAADGGRAMRPWVDGWCHRLKHEPGAAAALIADLEARGAGAGQEAAAGGGGGGDDVLAQPGQGRADGLRRSWSAQHIPIGSGVTEAACKVLVKQRLCGSGMKWKERGCGGGAERAVPDVHDGAVGAVLGEDRPLRVPGGGMTDCGSCRLLHESAAAPIAVQT